MPVLKILQIILKKIYKQDKAEYFTSAGRTEIIGNHTDHNGGKVIAGSINLDTIGAAYPNDTQVIHITSEGYRDEIVVDLTKLSKEKLQKKAQLPLLPV